MPILGEQYESLKGINPVTNPDRPVSTGNDDQGILYEPYSLLKILPIGNSLQ